MIKENAALIDVERAYDLAASHYDDWKWQDFWRRREAPFVLDQIKSRYSGTSDANLLDLGCGTGYYLSETQGLFGHSFGIDKSREMLSVAQRRAPFAHLVHDSVDMFRVAQRFDVILATRIISHLPDWGSILEATQRMLKKDGLLVITGVHSAHDYSHTRLPTINGSLATLTFKHKEDEIFDCLLQRGFYDVKIIEIEGDGRCGETGAASSGPVGWAAAMKFT